MHAIDALVHRHHRDEKDAVEDALPTQKLRISIERRIHNMEVLVHENVPESEKKHKALAKVADARLALEDMLNSMDSEQTEHKR